VSEVNNCAADCHMVKHCLISIIWEETFTKHLGFTDTNFNSLPSVLQFQKQELAVCKPAPFFCIMTHVTAKCKAETISSCKYTILAYKTEWQLDWFYQYLTSSSAARSTHPSTSHFALSSLAWSAAATAVPQHSLLIYCNIHCTPVE